MDLKPTQTRLKPAALELHIEELVLHGFASRDRARIGDAMEKELVRLLGEQSLPALFSRHAVTERLDAGTFKIVPGAKPQAIGAHLGQSLHHRFSRPDGTQSPKSPAKGGWKTR